MNHYFTGCWSFFWVLLSMCLHIENAGHPSACATQILCTYMGSKTIYAGYTAIRIRRICASFSFGALSKLQYIFAQNFWLCSNAEQAERLPIGIVASSSDQSPLKKTSNMAGDALKLKAQMASQPVSCLISETESHRARLNKEQQHVKTSQKKRPRVWRRKRDLLSLGSQSCITLAAEFLIFGTVSNVLSRSSWIACRADYLG